MSERERFERLRLIRSPRIGPVSYRQLLARFGSAGEAVRAIPMLAERGGGRASVADAGAVEHEIAATRALGGRYLLMGDADYPVLLDQMEGAPPALIVRGDAALAARPCVAIVGARNASAAACRFARSLAQDLGQREAVVVSGLARGIDTEAHRGSVDSGTIGVIACGIDMVFPPENAALQEEVAQRGLLVTEHPPGVQPLARHFPARNRIIAGLALGTVVVEAAPKSGSLITARLAGEAGREVMAVPGSPIDPRAQGCNLLMQASTVARRTIHRLYRLIPETPDQTFPLILVAHPVRVIWSARRGSKSFRMAPTARAAQMRSDCFHCGVPTMGEEPSVEFIGIENS
ncbi:DNA-processing protein DprA [Sphingobium lactosutens]|uniref:Smf/DprA SLOG domain-containing protein n=1 Tax=Sphingobium lactosutens DS20 TaxID=1331060 RepID=T0HGQ6_9SPHN|nr:DNA-processing protein DprA [Sphingobium lactosutens]EQB11278.1 hypothetical protein RLDS_23025 [Sphingobium lactosutens DS20]